MAGFQTLYQKLERSITVSGYSHSTLTNYSRCFAKMAQHFNMNPILLDEDRMLKHRLILGLLYGCGLRCFELRKLLPHRSDQGY